MNYAEEFNKMAVEYAPKVAGAIITLIIGLWLIGWITRMLSRVMQNRGFDETIRPFLASIVGVGLKILLLLTVAGMFGIQTTSFIAIFSALALAIGLALQGSLGHFASGVLILLFKPYKVGDIVELSGNRGTVESVQVFNTVLKTPDNKRIIIPNGLVTSNVIKNISGQGDLRVDMTFGIGYKDDIDKARAIIQKVADSCEEIDKNKPVDIMITALADSSVNFVVRPWTTAADYWKVHFYMHEHIKKAFDKEGVSIPYPQMDVHTHAST